jgi:hypothetical protein
VQREKEAELVFRGEQYARAVALFRAKNSNAFPPNIDVLVQGKYLRKKYLDPITNKDFDVIGVGAQSPTPGQGQGTGPGRGSGTASGIGSGTGTGQGTSTGRGTSLGQPPSAFTSTAVGGVTNNNQNGVVSGGIMGVHSKSQETSIRIYKGQTRYDQWNFVFTAANRPGATAPGAVNPGGQGGATTPGGRGGRGTGSGGRGQGPGTGGQNPFGLPPPPPPPPLPGTPRGRGGAAPDVQPPNL